MLWREFVAMDSRALDDLARAALGFRAGGDFFADLRFFIIVVSSSNAPQANGTSS